MALSRVVSGIFNVEKCLDLEIGYGFLLVFFSNIVPKMHHFEIFDFKNAVTSKTGFGVRQGHWIYHHSIERIRLPIDIP